MSKNYYINKDIYVGNTGKQLKDIKTNKDLIDLNAQHIEQLKAVVLYNGGNAGTTGNVTLSDDWDKYDYLEIFYTRAEYEVASSKVPKTCMDSSGNLPITGTCCFYGYGTGFWIGWKKWLFMGNNKRSLTNNAHGNGYITANNQTFKTNTEETMKCLKVIGWKI